MNSIPREKRVLAPCNDRQTIYDAMDKWGLDEAYLINFNLLDWIEKTVLVHQPELTESLLPTEVSPQEFLELLACQNGIWLKRLAIRLGSSKAENIQNRDCYEVFYEFAKNDARLAHECIFSKEELLGDSPSHEDYKSVFYTLYKLANQARNKFGVPTLAETKEIGWPELNILKEMKDQNSKLIGQTEMGNEGNSQSLQKNPEQSIVITQNLSQLKRSFEDGSNDLGAQMDVKKAKLTPEKSSIQVANWLIEVLAWIKRTELADSQLSISCRAFKQLCWPKLHGNVKNHTVRILSFLAERDKSGIFQLRLKRGYNSVNIPIANIRPPNYILGFGTILIKFFDAHVMRFIECIQPILNKVCLDITMHSFIYLDTEQIRQIHYLVEMLASKSISMCFPRSGNFLRYYSTLNGIFENVQSIYVDPDERGIDLLVQWLNKSRADQKPKMLRTKHNANSSSLVDRIKEKFSCSTQPANFLIIFLHDRFKFHPNRGICSNFILENEQTNEVLALYPDPADGTLIRYFIVRHPKGNEYLRSYWEIKIRATGSSSSSISVNIS